MATFPFSGTDFRGPIRDFVTAAVAEAVSAYVPAAQLGLKGDGTDESVALTTTLNAFVRANPGNPITFDGAKTYGYADNTFLKGARHARLIGNGARWKSLSPGGYSADRAFLTGVQHFLDGAGTYYGPLYPGVAATVGYRIDTAEAGATTVTLLTPGEGANFAAGDWVLVYGYPQQGNGWPVNPRYHDVAQVLAVVDGAVSLSLPLRHRYDAEWYDYTQVGFTWGKPRLKKLPYFAESVYLEEFAFLKNANDVVSTHPTLGAVIACAAKRVTFKNCEIGYLDPTQAEFVELIDCRIHTLEVDKLLTNVSFTRCRIGAYTAGDGADRVFLTGCEVTDQFVQGGGDLNVEDTDIYVGTATATGGVGLKLSSGRLYARNVKFHRKPGNDGDALIGPGEPSESITVVSVPDAQHIEVAINTQDTATLAPFGKLRRGMRLWKADGTNAGDVVEVRHNAVTGRAVVEATFRNTPAPSDVFFYHRTRSAVAVDCWDVDAGGSAFPIQFRYAADRVESAYSNTEESGLRRIRVPLPGPAWKSWESLPRIDIGGIVTRVEVHVVAPGVGYLTIGPIAPSESWQRVIGVSAVGSRRYDLYQASGLVAADLAHGVGANNEPIPTNNWVSALQIGYDPPTPATYPTGWLVIEWLPSPFRPGKSATYPGLSAPTVQVGGGTGPTLAAAAAVPAAGTWRRGDIVWNTAPAVAGAGGSQYVVHGWRCVAAGTPGTWVEMRMLTGT